MKSLDREKLRLSTVTANTPEAEQNLTARLIAKNCRREHLAGMLDTELALQQRLTKQLRDCEARISVLNAAWSKL
jgi:hypothetical protein